MISHIRYIWQLLVLTTFLILLGSFIVPGLETSLNLQTYVILLGSVALVNFISYLVIYAGIRKHNQEGVVVLIAGIGLKFLLYLLVILVFWLVTKNLFKPFIIVFFALYLIFTFFLVVHLFKALKNK